MIEMRVRVRDPEALAKIMLLSFAQAPLFPPPSHKAKYKDTERAMRG